MLCRSMSVASQNFLHSPPSMTDDPISFSTTTGSLILRPTHGKLKHHPLPRQFPIDLGVGIEPEIDAAALLLVQDHLEHLAAVLAGAGALADDFDGVDHVVEDGVMNCGQRARVGPFLRLRRPRSIAAFGARENAARGQEEDVSVRELLLEFSRQAVCKEEGVSAFFGGVVGSFCLRRKTGGVGLLENAENCANEKRSTVVGLCGSLEGGEREQR